VIFAARLASMAELPSGPAKEWVVERIGGTLVKSRLFDTHTADKDVLGLDASGQLVVMLAAGATAQAVQVYYAEKGQHT
jgi:hypothetical protein